MTDTQRRKYRDALARAPDYVSRVVMDFSAPEHLAWCAYHSVETPEHYSRRRVRDDVRRIAKGLCRVKVYVNRTILVPGRRAVAISGYRVSSKRFRAAMWSTAEFDTSRPPEAPTTHALTTKLRFFEPVTGTGQTIAWLLTAALVHGGAWVAHLPLHTWAAYTTRMRTPEHENPAHQMRKLIQCADPAAAAALMGPALGALDAWEAVRPDADGSVVDWCQAAVRAELEQQIADLGTL